MSRLEEARHFREVFGQEMLDNISRYGFIKKQLWSMQLDLIKKRQQNFLKQLTKFTLTQKTIGDEKSYSKNSAILSSFATNLLLLLTLIWTRLYVAFTNQI